MAVQILAKNGSSATNTIASNLRWYEEPKR